MQSVRTAFVSLQKSLLQPTKNVVSINSQRTYVRNFWEENNDYKGIPGHTRNPPKMFGYTRSKRNVSSHVPGVPTSFIQEFSKKSLNVTKSEKNS